MKPAAAFAGVGVAAAAYLAVRHWLHRRSTAPLRTSRDIALDRAETVAAELRAKGVSSRALRTDCTDPDAITAMVDTVVNEFGSLDIAVVSVVMSLAFLCVLQATQLS